MIVTGSNTGVGKEIAQVLYSKNARVYMMGRSEERMKNAIQSIKKAVPQSAGDLTYIHLDLADLETIKPSVEKFLAKEQKLDVLFNNAGVAFPEKGSRTKQGYELQLGVNCIGVFALTKLLTPTLVSTAKTSQPNSVRVVWVSSSAAQAANAKGFMNQVYNNHKGSLFDQYSTSKLGNFLQSTEFAGRHKKDGIVSTSLNPGNLDSDLWRTQGPITTWFLKTMLLYPSIYGAYTCLFSGFSPQVSLEKSGSHIAPWGRLMTTPNAMVAASKNKSEGGAGFGREFWDWSDEQVKKYI
ncbi:NAD(P)-binding protein [Annulohypoxylon maeteangense]|uniref:NAD(P)-binding protein n=1 Tax=Annulohypoxylon maeteangense TaxID=1927788 RepID=UPI002008305A|nr:NAD(P)-binding protein [Annulohypoxylon maeteangense]KAI0884829.1 NAD(P)-binding protein [Annulohypoxylon maeteangense]